jgi:RNA polymerase sigma factor (sigma-70 family)
MASRSNHQTTTDPSQARSAAASPDAVEGGTLRLVDRAPSDAASAPDGGTAERSRASAAAEWPALMARAQEGDGEAYARLLREITPYLRSFAARRLINRANVEDAVQDVLLTIHALRHTYDPNRPFGPWLVTIARRRIIDRFRQEARKKARETALTPAHETSAADPTNRGEESADRYALWQAVDSLPPGQREAIRLLKLEEMSLKEASVVSGMSIGALKVTTHRALKTLRKILAGRNP